MAGRPRDRGAGSPRNPRGPSGGAASGRAVWWGGPECPVGVLRRLLIQAGYELDVQDHDGWTPLHAAAHWGVKEACSILAEALCDMDVRNKLVSRPEPLQARKLSGSGSPLSGPAHCSGTGGFTSPEAVVVPAQCPGRPCPPPASAEPRLAVGSRAVPVGAGSCSLGARHSVEDPRGTGPSGGFQGWLAARPRALGCRGHVPGAGARGLPQSRLLGRAAAAAARCEGRTAGRSDQVPRSPRLPCRARRRSRWRTRVWWSTWRPCRSSRAW